MTGLLGLPLVAKATLVLLLALGAVIAMRRARAARRALVLAAAFAVLLALPVASLVAPPVPVEVPAAAMRLPVDRMPAFVPPDDTAAPAASVRTADAPPAPVPGARLQAPVLDPLALAHALWTAGVVLALGPFLLALWRIRTLARTALPWHEGTRFADRLRLESGIRRTIDVALHERARAPMTFGLLRPTILLPDDAPGWGEADLRQALVHEIEHARRLDWLVYLVARPVCALYWFHPLVWMAWRRLCLDTERACDDAVLERSDGDTYAGQLVALAQRLSVAARPLLGMASRSDLSTRVHAILDRHQTRGPAGSATIAGVACSACLLLAIISPLQAAAPGGAAPDGPAVAVRVPPAPAAEPGSATTSAQAMSASQAPVPGGQAPSFVASIRRSTSARRSAPGHGGVIERLAGGRMAATGVTIFDLVRYAYGLDSREPIAGAREWSDLRFDIEIAPAPGVAASPRTVVPPRLERQPFGYTVLHTPLDAGHWMMQALLEERFELRVQFATLAVPRYRAVLVNDGVPGPNLRPSALDCDAIQATRQRGERPQPPPGYEHVTVLCGMRTTSSLTTGLEMVGTGVPIRRVISATLGQVGLVVDDTGLAGTFDVDVRAGPPRPGEPWDVWRATAIEALLGLRLEPDPEPLQVLQSVVRAGVPPPGVDVPDGVSIEHVAMPAGV